MYALRKFASDYASCLLQFQWFCIFTFHQCNSLYFLRFWLFIHVKKNIYRRHSSIYYKYVYTIYCLATIESQRHILYGNIQHHILNFSVYPIMYFQRSCEKRSDQSQLSRSTEYLRAYCNFHGVRSNYKTSTLLKTKKI